MSTQYPPQGPPQNQPFGQPPFVQQPPAGFQQPGYGPVRPTAPGLPRDKKIILASILGAALACGLLSLFLPIVSSSNVEGSLSLSDGDSSKEFIFDILALVAAGASLGLVFLDYTRVPRVVLYAAGGTSAVLGAINLFFWFDLMDKIDTLMNGYGTSVDYGIGFWLWLLFTGILIAAAIMMILFAVSSAKTAAPFAPNFAPGAGPIGGYPAQAGFGQAPAGSAPAGGGHPGYGQPSAHSAPSFGGNPGPGVQQPAQPGYGQQPPRAGQPYGNGQPPQGQVPGAGPSTPGQPTASGYVSPIAPQNPNQYPNQ